jgi:hypothetical protein
MARITRLDFLVDQEGALGALGGAVDGRPQFEQVVQVPLQFGRRAADAGGARDDGHAVRVFELVHGLLELGPVVAPRCAGSHRRRAGLFGISTT